MFAVVAGNNKDYSCFWILQIDWYDIICQINTLIIINQSINQSIRLLLYKMKNNEINKMNERGNMEKLE